MRDELDRFYTHNESVDYVLSVLKNIDSYDVVIEPSAGSGAFSERIKGCLAFDIQPALPNIIKKDWFTVQQQDIPEHKKMLIIGNPPFGIRGSLAKKFIEHAIQLNATTIAFILPNTFSKFTNQRMFNEEWRLAFYQDIPNKYFTEATGNSIYIPCSFFIWTKDDTLYPHINLRDYKIEKPTEYSFLKRGDNNADFVINGNNGKVKNVQEVKNSKAEHYIKVSENHDAKTIKNIFEQLSFNFVSSVNGGVSWINRDDINKSFDNYKKANTI